MLAYSHIGDTLSETGVAKPSEMPAALDAYLKMYEAAQKLHKEDPADFRALTDIGIATMRVAKATADPDAEAAAIPGSPRLYAERGADKQRSDAGHEYRIRGDPHC